MGVKHLVSTTDRDVSHLLASKNVVGCEGEKVVFVVVPLQDILLVQAESRIINHVILNADLNDNLKALISG